MRLKSSMKKRRESNTRCGDTSELKRVTGMRSERSSSPIDPSTAGVMRPTARASGPANISGRTTLLIIARDSSDTAPGGDSGNHGSGGSGAGGSTVVSCSRVMISEPPRTSIAAWWILARIAKLSLGRCRNESSPSTRYSSHSGLDRSSGRAWMRDAWMQNCRQSPGFGSAMWRTWYSRSKLSSSIQ